MQHIKQALEKSLLSPISTVHMVEIRTFDMFAAGSKSGSSVGELRDKKDPSCKKSSRIFFE